MNDLPNLNTLVLGGGAIRGFALLGAIQYMQDKGLLTNVNKYIGTSIGAIIAYLLCIGYAPVEIMVVLCQNNFLDRLGQFNFLNMMNGGGATSFSVIQDVIEKLTIQKIGRLVTMGELYGMCGKILVCSTYNHTSGQTQYIDHTNYGSTQCLVILRMSANLPFLFEPFLYDGNLYLDGGIVDNVPTGALGGDDVAVALRLLSQKKNKDITNFLDYAMDILTIPVRQLEEARLSHNPTACTVISIPLDYATFHFNLNNTDKFDLFSIGYNTVREYFRI